MSPKVRDTCVRERYRQASGLDSPRTEDAFFALFGDLVDLSEYLVVRSGVELGLVRDLVVADSPVTSDYRYSWPPFLKIRCISPKN